MKRHSTLLTVCLLAGLATQAVPAAENWKDLFDGKTLTGWIQRGGKAKYTVEDNCIVGATVLNTGNSFLCTEKDYGDFILELEFKVDPKLNSGVQIRSLCFEKDTAPTDKNGEPLKDLTGKVMGKIPAGRVHGYQVEIDPAKRAWSGGIYEEGRRGWLNDLSKNDAARAAFKQGEWNKFRIECKGDAIKTWLNGVPAADLKDEATPKGFIGLQVHGIGKDAAKEGIQVRWRNIRIQELN